MTISPGTPRIQSRMGIIRGLLSADQIGAAGLTADGGLFHAS
jgi:hypothetical protein